MSSRNYGTVKNILGVLKSLGLIDYESFIWMNQEGVPVTKMRLITFNLKAHLGG